ncbi:MAG: hypothetical protein ACOCUA_00125 [archaeon]
MEFVPPTSRRSLNAELRSELGAIPFGELIPRLEEERIVFVSRIAEAVERAAGVTRAVVHVEWVANGSMRAYLFPEHRYITGTKALPFAPRVAHIDRNGSVDIFQGSTIPPRQIALWMCGHRDGEIDKDDLRSAMVRCGYPAEKADEWIHWAQVDGELTPVDGETVRL